VPTARVTVTLTHAQVAALRRLVLNAEAADLTAMRFLTAAQVTDRTRTVRSARAAMDRMDVALGRQDERRARREARASRSPGWRRRS
jgi:hypothetical protein